jgi:putative endonuclease
MSRQGEDTELQVRDGFPRDFCEESRRNSRCFFVREVAQMSAKPYEVYVLECADGTFYTGITTDLNRRLRQHESGEGAKYTRGRGPFIVRWVETGPDRSWALKREREIKRMSRRQKERLMYGMEV